MKIDFSSQLDARSWFPVIALLAAMLLCLVVYWPGLNGPMLYDDFPQLGRFFHQPAGQSLTLAEVWLSNSGPLGRPVSMLTFWLNSVFTPDDLAAWKLTNLVIHLLCGLFAGLLAMELFSAAHRERGTEPRYLGAFVGIAWLLHPLQVSTVLYTVQRMTELAALFGFAGLYTYVRSRRDPAASPSRTVIGLILLSLATVLAGLSKENGLLLPFLALIVELMLFHAAGTRASSRFIKSYFGVVCLLALLAAALLFILRPHFITGGYTFRGFTLGQRLLSEPRILFDYLAMLLAPVSGNMGFFHDDFVLSSGWLHPATTLLSALGLVGLIVSAWFARRRLPLYALGVAIFLIGQSMESSFIALRPMFEHRNYLPDFGVLLGITDLAAWLLAKRGDRLRLSVAGVVLLTLTVLLGVRVAHWSSSLSFYRAAVRAHPESSGALAGLAQTYLDAGKPELALKLLAPHPGFGAVLQRAYIKCKVNGTLPDATLETLLTQPMGHLNDYPVTGLTLLGKSGIQNQCAFSNALYSQLIDRAAAEGSTQPSLRYMLYIYSGYYHQRRGQLAEADAAMRNAHRMSPTTPVPLILSARWYLAANNLSQAEERLQQALNINRRYHGDFGDDISALQTEIEQAKTKPPRSTPH